MYSDQEGLGVIPLAPILGGLAGIFGGGNPKDAGRIDTNSQAYSQAVSGHDGPFQGYSSALEFLRVHAVMNDPDGGWATQAATTDASTKYKQALARLNPTAIISPGSTQTVPSIAGTGATGGINPIGEGGINQAAAGTPLGLPVPVLAGAGLLLIFLATRRK